MNHHKHAQFLGALISHLQSFEYLLRLYLLKTESKSDSVINSDVHLLPEGTFLDINALNNYDSLKDLILKFNKVMEAHGKRSFDFHHVKLRDALAHGRIYALEPEGNMRIIKFSNPDRKSGKVSVEMNQIMSEDWFVTNIGMVEKSMFQVLNEMELLS